MIITTQKCTVCGKASEVEVDPSEYANWKNGQLIQHAMPSIPIEHRELLISGTHDACWNELFGEDEDDEAS